MEDSPVKSLKLRMAKDRCYMLLLVFKGIFWKTLLGNLTKSSELGLFAALIFCSLWRRPVALIILHGAEEFKAKKNQTTCKLQGSSWQSKAFVTLLAARLASERLPSLHHHLAPPPCFCLSMEKCTFSTVVLSMSYACRKDAGDGHLTI